MKEQLLARGWVMYYKCKCSGGKEYYSNASFPGFEVRIRIKNNTFSIILSNMVIAGPFWGYQLKEMVDKYVK